MIVIGHRGAPAYRPEHTRSSYELAIAAGVDAVEPDLVVSRDGVLVVRHENEISGTTDVADRAEFADRRTTKRVDGEELSGWFAEDFTWAELATLTARERLPRLRPDSARFDGEEPILRLRDLFELVQGRGIRLVLEIKHADFFAALGWDLAALVAAELADAGWTEPVVIESFEPGVLAALRERGVSAEYVQLVAADGAPADLVARFGVAARPYPSFVTPAGLDGLAHEVDAVSLDKALVLADPGVVVAAHACGLRVYAWTCRPENVFLDERFRLGSEPTAFGDWRGEWGVLRDAGVDGVFVDHPDLGVAFFRD
ncbi:glycerophosphodiester phosphodiesterase family protein [Microbacterium sp. X-17]|uniref:glycerophosphodiester phosphodiesterase family protein n=1 Tax=Microbacterium sp. X-17 TaxID=3144404 RepID=UPI0031F5902F